MFNFISVQKWWGKAESPLHWINFSMRAIKALMMFPIADENKIALI